MFKTTKDRIFDMKRTNQHLREKIVILESEKSTVEEKAKESDAKNKQILNAKNAQIKSLKKQVVVADQEAPKKVSLANKKLDASLAREEATNTASQKTIDVLEINSKSEGREKAKRSAQALEKKMYKLRKKVCM